LIVAIVGAGLSFAANALSHGITLSRDYYPAAQIVSHPANSGTNAVQPGTEATNSLAAQLHSEGLQLADSNMVVQLFHDQRYQQSLVMFVDARSREDYAEGHIPGAYLFDYYHPESYIATVLPLCLAAQEVVVYCNGGECETSRFAARLLKDASVPGDKLFVYGGGITEWTNAGRPVELGDRNSGNLHRGKD
jgi:rhodanese-related sulfurtransferase